MIDHHYYEGREKMSTPALKIRWMILLTLCIDTAITNMVLIAPAPLMGPISQSLGVNLGQATGAMMGTFNLFVGISCIIGGWLLDKLGPIRVWLGCLCLMIISLVLGSLDGISINDLIVLRAIQGIATGPIMASAASVAANWFPMKERGIVTGLQGMSVGLGVAIGFVVAPKLFQLTGVWTETIAWLSIFCLAGLVLTLAVAHKIKASPNYIMQPTNAPVVADASDLKLALRKPITWAAVGCVLWMSWLFQGFNDLVPGYIAIPRPIGLGLGPMVAGQDMMALQVAFMFGAIFSGFIVEKVFQGRSKSAVITGFVVFALLALSLKLPFVTTNESILMLVLMVTGFFQALVNPTTFSFIAKNYPEHLTGRIGGLAQGLGIFGGAAGVFAGAYALDTTGLYYVSLTIVIVVAMIGALFAVGLNPIKSIPHISIRAQIRN